MKNGYRKCDIRFFMLVSGNKIIPVQERVTKMFCLWCINLSNPLVFRVKISVYRKFHI